MKKILLGLAICLNAAYSFGQITLEKKYSTQIYLCNLDGIGIKYFVYQANISSDKMSATPSITIYNSNHSVFKTINTKILFNSALSINQLTISCVTNNLFNKISSDIEFMAQGGNGQVQVVGEDNSVLLQVDSTGGTWDAGNDGEGAYCTNGIYKIDGAYKLVLQNRKVSDGYIPSSGKYSHFLIYSLPGSLPAPTALNEEKLLNQDKALLSAPMPNPSSETTRIEFQLPAEANMGEITVYNNMGLRVKSYKVDNAFGDLLLNNSDLSSGNYTYQLVAGGKRIGSQKMMVIK